MNQKLLKVLSWVSTTIVCDAISMARSDLFSNYTRGPVIAPNSHGLPMLGYALTAKLGRARPDADLDDQRTDYYRYVADGPDHSIVVLEDSAFPDCASTFLGEFNLRLHKRLGVHGVLTNGMARKQDDPLEQFPVLAGSIGLHKGASDIISYGGPVSVFGLTIKDGDFVHADENGAVIIPHELLPVMDQAISKVISRDKAALRPVLDGTLSIDDLLSLLATHPRQPV